MNPEELTGRNLENEFIFSTSRSGGPGGQNVNKVSTKVELRFNLVSTSLFTDSEKEIIFRKLKNKINKEGELILVSQSERTQLMNKKKVTEKFYVVVSKALTVPVKRRSTKPTFASKVKRLEEKKNRGNIKKLRKDSGGSTEEH
ncbi:MAG: alternative ribosome rescue aminoacyl-tRNA hydrolase ArfB [Bacteroidales bacterium]|nr:alternative ribosome rescue aminoacyl-tRNA hydrolase ArfB [Bacteroidales bacterium]MDP3003051.1 alternative ribosome rescue aminoacyl-tRNA hydrolase ArfB [Bacteroidales bacterium]